MKQMPVSRTFSGTPFSNNDADALTPSSNMQMQQYSGSSSEEDFMRKQAKLQEEAKEKWNNVWKPI